MTKIIPCVMCDEPATYTLQPSGGSIIYYCTEHFDKVVHELEN